MIKIILLMKIKLNGEEINLGDELLTVQKLLDVYGIDKRKIALEKNGEIVFRKNYEETNVNDGDNIEIIHFIGGG